MYEYIKGAVAEVAPAYAVIDAGDAPLAGADGGSFDEALAALVMLGFARAAAEKVLRGVMRELPRASVEELIRAALKRL